METIYLHNKKFNIQFQICSPEGMVSRLSPGWSGHLEKEKKKELRTRFLPPWLLARAEPKTFLALAKAEMESLLSGSQP